ncbi:uncharacterized protein K452DRAFT_161225 [Aplosporella prunicola CBS 121167]|uniref:Uncharacterized protein n=1 Tax=Aplosporella prunicola CBS 121167 TaxID=1176127 RepID=A0A6A6BK46_9PEZI|nr:uncharacterized protein K452DRAFT_161225 [Aplosporella prunicola CBS 121167]KAF2143705.1 hypothetical protein K452DRAFT_161225 [Aplosporella prunicola CBS 121167]
MHTRARRVEPPGSTPPRVAHNRSSKRVYLGCAAVAGWPRRQRMTDRRPYVLVTARRCAACGECVPVPGLLLAALEWVGVRGCGGDALGWVALCGVGCGLWARAHVRCGAVRASCGAGARSDGKWAPACLLFVFVFRVREPEALEHALGARPRTMACLILPSFARGTAACG